MELLRYFWAAYFGKCFADDRVNKLFFIECYKNIYIL